MAKPSINVPREWLEGLLTNAKRVVINQRQIDALNTDDLMERLEVIRLIGYIESAENLINLGSTGDPPINTPVCTTGCRAAKCMRAKR